MSESAVATSKSYISDAIDAWFKPALDEVKKTALSTRTKVTNASEFDQSLRRMFEMCNNLIQVLLVRTEDLHSFFPPEFEVPNLIAKSILVSIESAVSTALFAPIRELGAAQKLSSRFEMPVLMSTIRFLTRCIRSAQKGSFDKFVSGGGLSLVWR